MAYMSQEQKAKFFVELKKVMPKDWKWSLSVEHRSTIVLTISKAPVDLNTMAPHGVNEYHLDQNFTGETLKTFQKILKALNLDNFDHSDPMTDYFHVGHYVNIRIGKWNKPFVYAK